MRLTEYLTERRRFDELTASLVMEQDLICVRPDDSARTLAARLAEHHFTSLPVVAADGRLVGLVTERDLLRALLSGCDLETVPAEAIMTRDIAAVTEETPVAAVTQLLQEAQLCGVPVVRAGRLVGMVFKRDVLFGYVRATANYWP